MIGRRLGKRQQEANGFLALARDSEVARLCSKFCKIVGGNPVHMRQRAFVEGEDFGMIRSRRSFDFHGLRAAPSVDVRGALSFPPTPLSTSLSFWHDSASRA